MSRQAMKASSSRRQRSQRQPSLNHLLAFSLPERSSVESQQVGPRYSTAAAEVVYRPYRKEQFVNANFRFLLNSCRSIQDPDACFDWRAIEQVITYEPDVPDCPICLCRPVIPRVTRCGHIYCLICMLYYFERCESRCCPICNDDIMGIRDLKSVKVLEASAVAVNKKVALTLLHRTADAVLAFPVNENPPPKILWDHTPGAMTFARFMLASDEYLEAESARELSVLLDQHQQQDTENDEDENMATIIAGLSLFEDMAKDRKPASTVIKENHSKQQQQQQQQQRQQTDYYFYQASDGQHVFLDSHDIRILRHEYGEYYQFPRQIEAIVTKVEQTILTKPLRKRLKYLGHLPIGSTITFIQMDLKGIVSADTLNAFAAPHPEKEEEEEEEVEEEVDIIESFSHTEDDDDDWVFDHTDIIISNKRLVKQRQGRR